MEFLPYFYHLDMEYIHFNNIISDLNLSYNTRVNTLDPSTLYEVARLALGVKHELTIRVGSYQYFPFDCRLTSISTTFES